MVQHWRPNEGPATPHLRPGLLELPDVIVAPFPTAAAVALAPFAVYEAMIVERPVVGTCVAPLRCRARRRVLHGEAGSGLITPLTDVRS